MSDYATCGLVLVCIAMTGGAGIAVCILRGCGGWCWLTCGLQLLAGPVMVLGTGATIYSTVDGAQPATNGTSTISDSQFRSLVVKVGVWYYLAIACYLGSVGLGIYIVCQDNPSAGRTPLTVSHSLAKSSGAARGAGAGRKSGLRKRRVPRGWVEKEHPETPLRDGEPGEESGSSGNRSGSGSGTESEGERRGSRRKSSDRRRDGNDFV